MRGITIAAVTAGLTLVGAATADELKIKPGLWRTTSNTTTPMGQTMTRTDEECLTETSFDPATMMQDAEGCEITRNEVSGNQLDFAMECDMQGNRTTVVGQFVSDGDQGHGNMSMKLDAGGMQMEMKMDWTAERIGDC